MREDGSVAFGNWRDRLGLSVGVALVVNSIQLERTRTIVERLVFQIAFAVPEGDASADAVICIKNGDGFELDVRDDDAGDLTWEEN